MAAAGIRSARTSSVVRNVASRIYSAGARNSAAAGSPFRSLNQKPLFSHRSIFRSPVELSSCVDTTMLPFHSATASALLTSLLSATTWTYGWPLEDH